MSFEMVKDVETLARVWKKAKPALDSAITGRGEVHSIEFFYQPLLQGQFQLWVANEDKGYVLTSIEQGAKKSRLDINLLGGEDLPSWVDQMNEKLTDFAKEHGCVAIQAITRPGFSKFVPDFVQDSHVYVKVING